MLKMETFETSNMQPVEIASTKKNPTRRQGKQSRQKHQDAFREKKGTAELAKIHAAAAKRTFADLDLAGGLELIAKLHIQKSRNEAQVPVTTRAAGFLSQEIVDEATAVAPRAVQNSGITSQIMYRVTLSQMAVQNSLAVKKSTDLQDFEMVDRQSEFVPQDAAEQVVSTGKTFGILSHLVNSMGVLKNGPHSYRTFVPPHPVQENGAMQEGDGPRRRARPRERILPDPFYVTIQSLRDVVVALADVQVPQVVRERFRLNNPIPGAQWEGDLLVNPDEICPQDYFGTARFGRDIDIYRRFISGVGAKMKSYLSECSFNGDATTAMLVSVAIREARLTQDDIGPLLHITRDDTFRTQFDLSDQQIIAGSLTLLGEQVNQLAFREPTVMTSRIEMSWIGMIRDLLRKE